MYQNGVIICPVCRYDMTFPLAFTAQRATRAFVVNIGLLQASQVAPLLGLGDVSCTVMNGADRLRRIKTKYTE